MYQGFWDFLFDEKLRETREILSKKTIKCGTRQKRKKPQKRSVFKAFDGGEEGIRTLVGLPPNGFQDRLVMTASIPLRMAGNPVTSYSIAYPGKKVKVVVEIYGWR